MFYSTVRRRKTPILRAGFQRVFACLILPLLRTLADNVCYGYIIGNGQLHLHNPLQFFKHLLKVVKISAVVCGGLGALLAIFLRDVISALTIFYTLLSSAPLLPLLAGLYSKRISAQAVIPAMLVSVIGTFTIDWLTTGKGFNGIPSLIYGVGTGAVVMFLLSFTEAKK